MLQPQAPLTPDAARTIGKDDFVYYGCETWAYVREDASSQLPVYMLLSADGTELGTFEKRDVAHAFAEQHQLMAVDLH